MHLKRGRAKERNTNSTQLFTSFPQTTQKKPTRLLLWGGGVTYCTRYITFDFLRGIVAGCISYTFNQFERNVAVAKNFVGFPEDGAEKNKKTSERVRHLRFLQSKEVIFKESVIKNKTMARKIG